MTPAASYSVATPRGTARVEVYEPAPGCSPRGSLILGHGAGGSTWSADLLALLRLSEAGWTVALVEQPWRVAGRKVASPPAHLDAAWVAVLAELRARLPRPWVVGGRSAGARVACRTAGEVAADAVLALAFPLTPPRRRRDGAAAPSPDRGDELRLVAGVLPLLVVQGGTDAFGGPDDVAAALAGPTPGASGRPARVVAVRGGHGFTARPLDVVGAVTDWLTGLP